MMKNAKHTKMLKRVTRYLGNPVVDRILERLLESCSETTVHVHRCHNPVCHSKMTLINLTTYNLSIALPSILHGVMVLASSSHASIESAFGLIQLSHIYGLPS